MFHREEYYEKLLGYVKTIRTKTDFVPDVAVVLGSGLGGFADKIQVEAAVEFKELEGFPVSTAPNHVGQFLFGTLNGVKLVALKGRLHYYEGYEMSQVVLPLRVAHLLGAKSVIITNAVGGINREFSVGSFMVAKDCITSFVPSPLRGPNLSQLGSRFVDVSEIYDKDLREKALNIGRERSIEIHEGVLLQTEGPHFETAAEIKMFQSMGADAAGMSSVVEAIACRHMGMKICGISCITNMATGISETQLSGEEVIEIANRSGKDFEILLEELIKEM